MPTSPTDLLPGFRLRLPLRALTFSRQARHQRGVATVEFALILPLLLLILFSTLEFGLMLYDQTVLTNASREGARLGIVLRDPPVNPQEIRTRVLSYTGNSLLGLGAVSGVTVDFPVPTQSDHLSVRVNYTFRGLGLGTVLSALDAPLVLTATTTMVRE